MEETLIIDAAERFLNGEMSKEERVFFEELRRNNPEVDRVIAEHIFFIQEMQRFSDLRKLKTELARAHQENTSHSTQNIDKKPIVPISQWAKLRNTIAVAASITIFSTVLCTALLNNYNKKNQPNIKPLVEKINEQDQKYKSLELQIGKLKTSTSSTQPKIKSSFRATGFLVDAENNLIVTNAHVINEAKNKLIIEDNQGNQYEAKSVFVDENSDLAIIKVTDLSFEKLSAPPYILDENDAEIGQSIFTLGYPKQEIVYGEGYVSAANGYQMDTCFFQLSTTANEGNSGSPVISNDGKIIGVISSTETNAQGVVFAIKSKNILGALRKISARDLKTNQKNTLKSKDRINQIKKVENYVFMIKGN